MPGSRPPFVGNATSLVPLSKELLDQVKLTGRRYWQTRGLSGGFSGSSGQLAQRPVEMTILPFQDGFTSL
jgi:hypothetical protein